LFLKSLCLHTAARNRAAPPGKREVLASIPRRRCKGFFTLDKRPNSLDFPGLRSNYPTIPQGPGGRPPSPTSDPRRKELKMMKNWQLGAILAVAAVTMYVLFWLNMTTR